MTKEIIQPMPSSVNHSQDLEVARRTNPAQRMYDNALEMAEGSKRRVVLTVNGKDEAIYEFVPKEVNVDPSNSGEISPVTIFEASTQLPSSVEGQNGHRKPMKEPGTNEALVDKRIREQKNRAIFSGIRGKTVYQKGIPTNIKDHTGNPENGANKKRRRGKRNGSR